MQTGTSFVGNQFTAQSQPAHAGQTANTAGVPRVPTPTAWPTPRPRPGFFDTARDSTRGENRNRPGGQ